MFFSSVNESNSPEESPSFCPRQSILIMNLKKRSALIPIVGIMLIEVVLAVIEYQNQKMNSTVVQTRLEKVRLKVSVCAL